MLALTDKLTSPLAMRVVALFGFVFGKIPHLPKKIVNFLVFLAPWLALIGIIIGVIAGPVMVLLTLLSAVTLDLALILNMLFSTLLVAANTVILLRAFRPLKNKELRGWIYLFWGSVIGSISIVSGIMTDEYSVLSGVVSILLGFVFIFQIRDNFGGAGRVGRTPPAAGVRRVPGAPAVTTAQAIRILSDSADKYIKLAQLSVQANLYAATGMESGKSAADEIRKIRKAQETLKALAGQRSLL